MQTIESDGTSLAKRSTEVRFLINVCKDKMVTSVFELGELLLEARNGEYHKEWGYSQFKDWVDHGSDLDMSHRQAYYLISILERSKRLGYTHEDLKPIKLSVLKEIYSVKDDEKVKELMAVGDAMSLNEAKAAVRPHSVVTHLNLVLTKEQHEDIMNLVERIRQIHGNTVNAHGEVGDISVGRALQLAAVEFLNYTDEQQESQIKALLPVESAEA